VNLNKTKCACLKALPVQGAIHWSISWHWCHWQCTAGNSYSLDVLWSDQLLPCQL